MERKIGFGITERQARDVFATVRGIVPASRRLGVSEATASKWARELGVAVLPYVHPRKPHEQKFSDQQCLQALLTEKSLRWAAYDLGVTPEGLLRRARYLGLPTDIEGRAALRQAHAVRAAA